MKHNDLEKTVEGKKLAWWIIFFILIFLFIYVVEKKLQFETVYILILAGMLIQIFGVFIVNRIGIFAVLGWGKHDITADEIEALKLKRK